MHNEVFAMLFCFKTVITVRTKKTHWSRDIFTCDKGLTTDFALVLTVATIVIVKVMMWSSTERTDGIFGDGFPISTLHRFYGFTILPLVVFEKELPVLFDEWFYDWELVYFELLVLWRMRIIESPLFERNVSANKI